MKSMTQEEKVISMMRWPAPKKKVGIIKLKMIREGTVVYGTQRFHEAKEAADIVRPLFEYSDREIMMVMSLDSAMTPIALEVVAVGGVSACVVDTSNLFKHAILSNASKIICFHNHPSGEPKPSREDSLITGRIKEAGALLGIELLDHIVIGSEGRYVSFREERIEPFGIGGAA
ncbi:JAB domain-containing protein [Lacrimispora celerecrescens]|uniref:DNA repair protein RadC n=1 Tax=[Clostridium] celerecrescens 18A TaxID=1286362 RepID=A0A2M8Z9L2_9FIRM|nr:JAB domain-containing protein [Lacrimispora celerecrescens]PJJ30135.1 DNA repair protein RadC [[Clostridium] celerecrescens 18A]